MSAHPICTRAAADCFALWRGQQITVAMFLADIQTCAEALPPARYAINICGDRYLFTVAFFAAAVRRQITLLPSKRSDQALAQLREQYDGTSVITDAPHPAADFELNLTPGGQGSLARSPMLEDDACIALAFTSGSTGEPRPHPKTWTFLQNARATNQRYCPIPREQPAGLVATVPSWHMYGLEWALMLPTCSALTLYCGADFFPQDVQAALALFRAPRMLVSTPLHLKALLAGSASFTPVAVTLSATAPLPVALAAQVEERLQTRLFEIYGCSEIGSLAYRFTCQEDAWTFFDHFDLTLEQDRLRVSADDVPEPVLLADRFSQRVDGGYRLLGRDGDMIKVGGKRESLALLNSVLLTTPGVADGLFYRPQDYGLSPSERVAAIAVAPGLTTAELRARLKARIDPAFAPRPLHLVENLPRESTSKIARAPLIELLRTLHDR